jgi:hypothetical protein
MADRRRGYSSKKALLFKKKEAKNFDSCSPAVGAGGSQGPKVD